jgi:hypothetical protein
MGREYETRIWDEIMGREYGTRLWDENGLSPPSPSDPPKMAYCRMPLPIIGIYENVVFHRYREMGDILNNGCLCVCALRTPYGSFRLCRLL